jgi:cell shape-determining protein MreD
VRWTVFAIFGAMVLVLDVSLGQVLALRSLGGIAPSFTAVLGVFVVFFAPRESALWASWLLGLLVDLCIDLPHGGGEAGPLVGAHALGYSFGAYLVLLVRAMLYRANVVTLAVVTLGWAAAAGLVVVFISAVHGWYPGEAARPPLPDLPAGLEMLRRLGSAAYSGALALALAKPLIWTIPLWGFRAPIPRALGRR